jgi:hypothetical protein
VRSNTIQLREQVLSGAVLLLNTMVLLLSEMVLVLLLVLEMGKQAPPFRLSTVGVYSLPNSG